MWWLGHLLSIFGALKSWMQCMLDNTKVKLDVRKLRDEETVPTRGVVVV